MIITVKQLKEELEKCDEKDVVKVRISPASTVAVHNRSVEKIGQIVVLQCY